MNTPYIKGQQVSLVVTKVYKKESGNGQRTFMSQNGMRYVYLVEFANGFIAEYPSPVQEQTDIVPGQELSFKVVDHTSYGYTIDLIQRKPTNPQGGPVLGTTGFQGHPAVYSMQIAASLAPSHGWEWEQMKEEAERIFNWLLDHKEIY